MKTERLDQRSSTGGTPTVSGKWNVVWRLRSYLGNIIFIIKF
jgi:hypothetical protein